MFFSTIIYYIILYNFPS